MSKKERRRTTVLCVDPRNALRPLVERGLAGDEVRVISAANGAAALQAIQGVNLEAVVSDLVAPVYSGADLSSSLKGLPNKNLPILLVFPEGSSDAAEVAARCEADSFVVGDPPAPAMGALVRGLLREAALQHRVHYVEELLRREQKRYESNADLDQDTGFLPLGVFKRVLPNEAKRASRYHIPLGLVLVGFDAYAPLKARYGERALAPLFADMASVILRVIRDIDIPVRSAPDTALLLLPHTDTQGAKRVGDRIAGQARLLRVEVAGERVRATTSIGVAGYDGVGEVSFADLWRRSKAALEAIQARGGDGVDVR
ncbi:MAG: diguanylate cyclase [Deltaproteobacteria bacterium]|nr:diguanylate cyclase [Deltaproteobacteria bacterium]